jgi:hypothetical protein
MAQMIKKKKNPAAIALGKLGGSKGGKARDANLTFKQKSVIAQKGVAARMKKISPERRSEIARNAVNARWNKSGK